LRLTLPEDVYEEHIVAYILHKKKTCGGTSVATYFQHVKAWFNWMVRRNIIHVSPFANLKKPTIPKTVIKPISPEQVQRMIDCCTDHSYDIRDKALVLLIYDSGLRRSEVSNIKLQDVDFKRGAIKVMGKGAKERYIGIGEETKKALASYLFGRNDTLEWLFTTSHNVPITKLSPVAVSMAIKRLMKRSGVTGVKTGSHRLNLAARLA